MKKATVIAAILLVAASCAIPSRAAAAETGEMLIVGFEKNELKAKSKDFFGEVRDANGGFDVWLWFETKFIDIHKRPTLGSRGWTWRCRTDDKTEGEASLSAKTSPPTGRIPWGTKYEKTPLLKKFYPVPRAETSIVMPTYGWFSRTPAKFRDWSKFDKMLVDIKLGAPGKVGLWIEDDCIEPPIKRSYDVKGGAWVTLELDLKQAVKERGLDTRTMTHFWITVNPKKGGAVRIDNIRVAKSSVTPKLKVLKDTSPLKLPPRNLPEKPITPPRPKIQRDTSPIKDIKPLDAGAGALAPLGWIAAIDNKRLFIGYTVPSGGPARASGTKQSLDGGATWQGSDTPVARNLDHGTSTGFVLDSDGDCASVSSGPGCMGYRPSPRQFMTKFSFDGTGWKGRYPPVPISADLRHCGWNSSVFRIRQGPKAGRLWHVNGQINRTHSLSVHACFSDDDGLTWYPWGKGGMIPGSRESEWTTNTYCYQLPKATEYKGHVAAFWQDRRGLLWTYFDGEKWTPITTIDKKARATLQISALQSFRVPGCAVTRGTEEIFITAWNVPGVLRFDGTTWHHELPNAADAGRLSVSGKQVFLITSGHVPEPTPQKYTRTFAKEAILCYRRDAGGAWHGPFCISPGGKVNIMRYKGQMPAVVVPPSSPPNFVPVAWSDNSKITVMKVPADISKSPFGLETTVEVTLGAPTVGAGQKGGAMAVTCSVPVTLKNISTKKQDCKVVTNVAINDSGFARHGEPLVFTLAAGQSEQRTLQVSRAADASRKALRFVIRPEVTVNGKLAASDTKVVPVIVCSRKDPGAFTIPALSGDDGSTAKINTALKVWRDGDNLRVLAKLEEPAIGRIVASVGKRDGPVFRDDDLELFFHTGKNYFQLIMNSTGTQCDSRNRKKSWNGAWTVTADVKKAERYWTADVTVPLKDLGMSAADAARGKIIRFNVARSSRASKAGFMAWSPTMTQPHNHERFGYLVFD